MSAPDKKRWAGEAGNVQEQQHGGKREQARSATMPVAEACWSLLIGCGLPHKRDRVCAGRIHLFFAAQASGCGGTAEEEGR